MLIRLVVGGVLTAAGVGLLVVGVLGLRGRLRRNRFAGVRTAATMRSDAAFRLGNRVAGPATAVAGALGTVGGAAGMAARSEASAAVLLAVAGVGMVGLAVAGGLLGHRAAAGASPAGVTGGVCGGGVCGGGALSGRATRTDRACDTPGTAAVTSPSCRGRP